MITPTHKVVAKRLPYSKDGINIEHLKKGDLFAPTENVVDGLIEAEMIAKLTADEVKAAAKAAEKKADAAPENK